ncbi:MAG TPA: PQQ-binding-like beta-propeller repeat protein [Phycisphaerae bacterium]|nr:PQQ-binding-like beta-propeller repeat protein [Phycisphaerae bacterium]
MRKYLAAVLVIGIGLVAATAWAQKKDEKVSAPEPTSPPSGRAVVIKGVVFEDLNGDGRRDEGEPALAGMPVSDGLSFHTTPADGRYEFAAREKTRGSVFVCTPAGWRASKQFFVTANFDEYDGKIQPGDIGLVRDPARNTDRFCFVQLSDTHVTGGEDTIKTMMADIDVVNRLTDTPTFIVTTGDLVNTGKKIEELKGYMEGTRNARFPFYNVIGNHDYGGDIRDTQNYEKHVGPSYYSFDVGPYHFIAKDIISKKEKDGSGAYDRQMKWMEEDIRRNAVGKRVILFQHYLPAYRELDWLAEHNGVAIFSGHWHGRRERVYKGVLDVNSATTRFGGIDRSPRGFRVIHVDGHNIRCEWRLGGQDKRAEIIQPALGGTVGGETIDLRALAYDSAVRVKQVRYRIFDGDKPSGPQARPLVEGDLWAQGSWSWTGRWQVPAGAPRGPKFIRVEVTGWNNEKWQKEGSFILGDQAPPAVAAGENWPFFHNDAGHRGYLPAGPRPPLSIAWAANVGGTIHISSPVIADGKVYAGSSFESSLDDCAVTALDLATGRPIWRAPVDSSVVHSLAAHGENVLAVTQAATLYCLDKDGFPRWTSSLAREYNTRWETSFPVTDGKTVYAGRCNGFGAYDLATGEPRWRQPGGADWWPSIYAGPSLGTDTVYQGGPFVRALDPASGKILWNNEKMSASTVAVVPAVVERDEQGDRLYVFNNGKTLRCLDGKTGKEIWEANGVGQDGTSINMVPLGNETGTPAVGEDIVCLGGTDAKGKGNEQFPAAMYGFDKATGKLRWKFPVGQGVAPTIPYQRESCTITSSPVIVGDIVYFGSSDGWFYALGAKDGQCVWKYWFGLPIASTVAVSGNTVVLAVWDGTVYALTAGS